MKISHLLSFLIIFFIGSISVSAQDVDEIVNNYLENTGGVDAWNKLKGVKMVAKVNQQGMEIPIEIVRLADGRQFTKVSFQGMNIMQGVFDGETLWNTNFQSMQAEKADAETTENFKLEINDFPDPLMDYKSKGYSLEYVGTETMDGAETYKLKLTREPLTVDGKEVENVTFYYFDTESYVPIAQEGQVNMGPQKGAIGLTKLSDYQEVEGLYFPFSLTQGIKGGPSAPLVIDSIILNPEFKDSDFAFPQN